MTVLLATTKASVSANDITLPNSDYPTVYRGFLTDDEIDMFLLNQVHPTANDQRDLQLEGNNFKQQLLRTSAASYSKPQENGTRVSSPTVIPEPLHIRIRSKLLLGKPNLGSSTSATEQEEDESPPRSANSYVTTITGTTDRHLDHYADVNVEEDFEVEVSGAGLKSIAYCKNQQPISSLTDYPPR